MTPESNCIFCKIINRELPASIVDEDDHTMTFLDNRPLFIGHCLLVPKKHVVTLMDLPDQDISIFFAKAKEMSHKVKIAMEAQGIFNAINNVVSQSVPHLHLHIVPRTKGDGLKGFFWPRKRYRGPDHMEEVSQLIAKTAIR